MRTVNYVDVAVDIHLDARRTGGISDRLARRAVSLGVSEEALVVEARRDCELARHGAEGCLASLETWLAGRATRRYP